MTTGEAVIASPAWNTHFGASRPTELRLILVSFPLKAVRCRSCPYIGQSLGLPPAAAMRLEAARNTATARHQGVGRFIVPSSDPSCTRPFRFYGRRRRSVNARDTMAPRIRGRPAMAKEFFHPDMEL